MPDAGSARTQQLAANAVLDALKMMPSYASLTESLTNITHLIEAQREGMLCSIFVLDDDGLHLRYGAAPNVSEGYRAATDRVCVGPHEGSCGAAAYLRQPVFIPDMLSHPNWQPYREVVLQSGLRAAWSVPVISKDGKVLGTFCMYSREVRHPGPNDIQLLDDASSLAGIAIERDRAEENLRTQAKLCQNEEEPLRIIDAIPQTVVVLNQNGMATYANRVMLEYTGLTVEEVQAEEFRARVFHPDDVNRLLEARQKALSGTVPFENEQRVLRKDGTYRWFLIRYNPFLDKSGKVIRWFASGTDIEDRKQIEELRATQARQASVRADVSVAFSKPSNLGAALHGCVESIVRHLDAAFARIWTLNDSGNILELQASAGIYTRLDGFYSRIPIGDLKVGKIALEKMPHFTNDVINDCRIADKNWARSGGFVSFAGYPLLVEERAVGVMALFAHHPLFETTIDTLASVADIIAQGIERKRVEEKLRAEERELRRITDAIPHLICVLGSDGSVLYANQLVLEYSGMNLQDVLADDFRAKFFHPEDLAREEDNRRHGLERGAPFELELRARRSDRHYRWFLIRYNPFRDEQGRVIRWYATGTDIEDRKQAEERVRHENLALREEIDKTPMFEEIVGSSKALRKIILQVAKVAPTDSTVLITGETGTGKELIARAIHKRSRRSSRAFVSVNCAAIPSSLIASELFGHEKGAFTGALGRRLGRFEVAEGGTLFLDEIGDLPMETQHALLRVLEEREFERVGGSNSIRANVRVIAATNRDLEGAITEQKFRADLFYRLNVFPLELPALRDRPTDIPLLAEYFIHRCARRAGKRIRSISRETLALLQSYDWPGNIRELQNVIDRAVIVSDSDSLSIDKQWLSGRSPKLSLEGLSWTTRPSTHGKDVIQSALKESKGRVAGPFGAATRLGISSSTLESRIKALKIDKRHFKSP